MENYPDRVTLFDDGVYRWSYVMDMWRNRFLFHLMLKVIAVVCGGAVAFVLVALGPSLTPAAVGWCALGVAGVMALAAGIYAICACVMHGAYRLCFEMDGEMVELVRSAATRQRNEAMAAIAVAIGLAVNRPGEALRTGLTMNAVNAAGRTFFSSVTRMRVHPEYQVIDLREWFGMNQIYVCDEDFAFVRDFIRDHISEKARARSAL
ncbi:MAG: hypothetical protein IJJ45_04865 [Clostridia bacterium]|nr:hypothetical protein [Clostridia bacterium]